MALVLDIVSESRVHGDHVFPSYDNDPRFKPTWWSYGSAKSPVSYCRFRDHGEEVARAKVLPGSTRYSGYSSWIRPPAGVTEIDQIEVRPDLRRRPELRYGRQAVHAIERAFGEPVIALSLDDQSDSFWRSLGWTTHRHPDGDRYPLLFTSA